MKSTAGMQVTMNDKLKIVWWDREEKRIYSQRKRTKWKSTAAKIIQERYLEGTVPAVKYIRDTYGFCLRDCMNVLNYLRGTGNYSADYLSQFD